ncbi:glycosyltransferase family 39 protein [Bombella sp. ESL0385]|uniref:ArnT family glycosyltransferase n=1 Tax=Bombella sp. ESL0385 TaxID=2676446 RepID=UPI0012D8DF1B|nr:glycosyltransferase family 39 protein [Bombella sp. ESL0385]MUG89405.1 hypothetical protein [Bombella sp. ESL0385]
MRSFLNASPLKKTLDNWYFLYFCLLLVAYLSRAAVLGNPFIFSDEEFYLFVGGRMLHGDLPYVDIWDRKPIGIFLIYEFFHLFGPYRIWAYQIGALLSAWLTSIFCFKIARSIAPIGGAFCAGCLYLTWIVGFGGAGGQTPIFYNTLVTGAVLLIVKYINEKSLNRLDSTACWVMILFGLAIQIKPTVVFEGVFAGLYLLWILYKEQTKNWFSICAHAIAWCLIALLPTLAVITFYTSIHHLHEWWFANVNSIFLKSNTFYNNASLLRGPIHNALLIFVLYLGTFCLRLLLTDRKILSASNYFLAGWGIAALGGYLVFGCFDKHYALPLFAPLFINAAPLWGSAIICVVSFINTTTTRSSSPRHFKIGQLIIIALLIVGVFETKKGVKSIRKQGSPHDFMIISQLLSSDPGCIFNMRAPDILLDIIPYCPLTRLPFSNQLGTTIEKNALPMDPLPEIKHILSQSPLYILMDRDPYDDNINPETEKFILGIINKSYKEIYRHRINENLDNIIIYKHK